MLCTTVQVGGGREIEIRANTGFRDGPAWGTLAFAVVASGGTGSAATVLDDSLAWVAAGKYNQGTNLSPSRGLRLTNVTRYGTWAVSRTTCKPAQARVPLSSVGLRNAAPGPLGVSIDCPTPQRILVRVRAVTVGAPSRYREGEFEKTKTVLQSGNIAVRTQGGKQLAFASVFDNGKTQLSTAPSCRED